MNGLSVNHGMISTKLDFTVNFDNFQSKKLYQKQYNFGKHVSIFEGTGNQVGRDGLVRS